MTPRDERGHVRGAFLLFATLDPFGYQSEAMRILSELGVSLSSVAQAEAALEWSTDVACVYKREVPEA